MNNSGLLDVEKVKKGSAARWIVPLILLLLVLALVTVGASSNLLSLSSGGTAILPFVLTALLCTLVAVSLTLTGCDEHFRRLTRGTEQIATDVISVLNKQSRLQDALLKSNRELADHVTGMAERQHMIQAGFGDLWKTNQVTSEKIGALVDIQDALQQAVRVSSERIVGSISALAADQEQFDGKADRLREITQTIAGKIAHVADEQAMMSEALQDKTQALADGQAAMSEALQNKTRVLADSMGACTQAQQTLRAEISKMAGFGQQTASAVAAVAAEQTAWHETATQQKEELNGKLARLSENQASLKADLNGLGEKTDRAIGEVAALADRQSCFGEALHAHTETLGTQMASLSTSQEQIDETVGRLQVLAQTAASSVTHIADEQAALHRTLRDNTEALTDSVRIIEQYQEVLQTEAGRVTEAGQQTVASLAAVAAEQTALNEGIRSTNEELTGQMGGLVDNQQTLQAAVHSLNEKTNRAVEEVAALTAEHASVDEALQKHTEAITAQVAGLAVGHGQLDTDVSGLRELAQGLAGSVADVSNGQAALHRCLQDNAQGLTDNIRAVEQNQKILQSRMCGLDEKAAQMAAEQTAWHETTQTQNEELSAKIVALLESQLTFHGGVSNLGEKTSQVASSLSDVAAEQAAIREALQAHAEAINSQMSALGVGQEQVDTSVHTLQDLTQTLTGSVAAMSDEQATQHASLQDQTRLLSESIEALERSEQAVQTEVHKVAEAGERSVARVTQLTDEQTTLHEAVRTHTDELSNQMGVLTESHRSLLAGVNNLGDKMGHVTAEVTALNTRQTSFGEALQGHAEVSDTQMSELTAGQAALHETVQTQNEQFAGQLSTLCENQQDIRVEVHKASRTGQDSAAAIAAIAAEQGALHETVKTQNEEIAGQLSTLHENQQEVQAEVHQVARTGQESAAAIAAVAAEQAALHGTVKTQNEGLAGQLSTLCENQQDIRVEIHKVSKTGQDSAAAITAIADEQGALHETVKTQNEGLAGQLSALRENQQDVQAEIHEVARTGQDSAAAITAVAAEQAALHETVKTQNEGLTDRLSALYESQQDVQAEVHKVSKTGQDSASDIAAIATEQAAVHETVRTQNEALADQLSALRENQQDVQVKVHQVARTGQDSAAAIAAVAAEQAALHETVKTQNEGLTDQLSALYENQQDVQVEVHKVSKTGQTSAADIAAIATEQAALHETVRTQNEGLAGQLSALREKQQDVQAEVHEVARSGQDSAAAITAVAAEQAALHETVQTHGEELTSRLSSISEDQRTLCTGIHGLDEKAAQIATGIDSVAHEQLAVQQLVQNSKRDIAETMAVAVREQQAMQTALAQLEQTAHSVFDRITALADTQDTLKETLHQANEQLIGGLTTLTSNHGQLHSNFNSLRELTQTVAGNVKNIAQEQAALHGTLQSHTEALSGSAAELEQIQTTLEANVNTVAEGTRQAATTVTAMAAEQARLLEAITAGSEELTGQIAALSDNQQVSREDLLTKLATVAQSQHEWMTQFQTVQAKTDAIGASLDTLEQNTRRFEQTLQATIHDLMNLLDAEGQQRTQFEETVTQDLKAIGEAASLIGEIQAALETQTPPAEQDAPAEPAENPAQWPSHDDIAWAIEQLSQGTGEPQPGNNGENADPTDTESTPTSVPQTDSPN